ncbi:MAG TPA: Hsp20/alpha crystallin family protein [Anaerolineae bacterium]|nr:Hsp20/alpha crystallin family protein [Anaerolineae bacterium]HQK15041.1 Hsp20/alpha crystallin family protein [Anaerolineae bacterium]
MFGRTFWGTVDPWNEMERLRREMNRLFSSFPMFPELRVAPGYPAMNVWTNEEGAVVTAELPGIDPEELDISVIENTLTLSGERKPLELKEGEVYHRRERGYGKFTRSFQLPFNVDANNVQAVYEKGVLRINLPRAEADKPRKIAVKAA